MAYLQNIAPGTSSRRDERLGSARVVMAAYISALRRSGSNLKVTMPPSQDRRNLVIRVSGRNYTISEIKQMTANLKALIRMRREQRRAA